MEEKPFHKENDREFIDYQRIISRGHTSGDNLQSMDVTLIGCYFSCPFKDVIYTKSDDSMKTDYIDCHENANIENLNKIEQLDLGECKGKVTAAPLTPTYVFTDSKYFSKSCQFSDTKEFSKTIEFSETKEFSENYRIFRVTYIFKYQTFFRYKSIFQAQKVFLKLTVFQNHLTFHLLMNMLHQANLQNQKHFLKQKNSRNPTFSPKQMIFHRLPLFLDQVN